MKRICALLVSFLALALSCAAQASSSGQAAETSPSPEPKGFYNTMIGVQIGTYKSSDSRFQEVYGSNTIPQLGLNLSRTIVDFHGLQLDLSLEARTLSKTGAATLGGEQTKISLVPLTAAFRVLVRTKMFIPFVGGGADWDHYSEQSSIANTSGWARGYDIQGGLYFVVPGADSVRVKLYYKYTNLTATANAISVKLGGPEYGIGVSFGFNVLNRAAVVAR